MIDQSYVWYFKFLLGYFFKVKLMKFCLVFVVFNVMRFFNFLFIRNYYLLYFIYMINNRNNRPIIPRFHNVFKAWITCFYENFSLYKIKKFLQAKIADFPPIFVLMVYHVLRDFQCTVCHIFMVSLPSSCLGLKRHCIF